MKNNKSKEECCNYCNSIMKISKKGNKYCSNICWEKEPWKTQRLNDMDEGMMFDETMHGNWGMR